MKTLLFLGSFLLIFQSSAQTIGNYNILILESSFGYSTNAQSQFQTMGHTATVINPALLITGFDYSPYDIVVFGFDSALPADLNHLLTENANCNVGIVIMRGDLTVDDLDMGASGFYYSNNFQIDNNSHWITAPYAIGALPLSFDFKSVITAPTPNTTTLGSCGGLASLLIHNTYKRVVMPYYGHGTGMPWSADADSLTNRVIAWAASSCCAASTGTDTRTECDSYTWIDGNTYVANNNSATFNIFGGAANGCDSLVTLDLIVNYSTSSSITESGLDVYTAPSGATYTSTGIYTDIIPNAAGCDSVITIDLTMNFTGISEFQLSSVNVYPNPSFETITLLISEDLLGNSIDIIDQSGRVIHESYATEIKTKLNLGKLESGLYYLKIGDIKSVKFVKQ